MTGVWPCRMHSIAVVRPPKPVAVRQNGIVVRISVDDVPAPMMITLTPVFGFAPLVTGPLSFVSREDMLGSLVSCTLARSGIRDFDGASQLAE
jgi:hypothetical protein